jgi:DNA-binding transcriptional ArsR family regulator
MSQPKTSSLNFEGECVELFAGVVYALGVPRSVGQIYGLLYASPVPLSFSDIVERLDISKGSASQGLQLLRSLGAINVADPFKFQIGHVSSSEARVRSVAYEPELSLRKLISGVLQERITPLTTTGGGRVNRLRELAERDGKTRVFYLGRVKQLETWRRRLRTVLPVLSLMLGPKRKK